MFITRKFSPGFLLYLDYFQTIFKFKSVKFRQLDWKWLTHLFVRRAVTSSLLFILPWGKQVRWLQTFFEIFLYFFLCKTTQTLNRISSNYFWSLFKEQKFLNYFTEKHFYRTLCVKGNLGRYFRLIFKTNMVYQGIVKSIKAKMIISRKTKKVIIGNISLG